MASGIVKKRLFRKITVVIFLTVLIWVWADLAQDETYIVPTATITVAKSAKLETMISLDDSYTLTINNIELKGSVSKINKIKRKLQEGSVTFDFFFDPAIEQNISAGGEYPLNVLDFLSKTTPIAGHSLSVVDCEPATIRVNIEELVSKQLTIQCYDENKNLIPDAKIDPPTVTMFVRKSRQDEKLIASVELTKRENEQARIKPFSKNPFIILPTGQKRESTATTKIQTPQQNLFENYTVNVTLGIAFSVNTQDEYRVEIANLPAVISSVQIRATSEAKLSYEKQLYQIILEIDDDDLAKSPDYLHERPLLYILPEEFVRKGEIELTQSPVEAQFKLIPLTPEPFAPQ